MQLASWHEDEKHNVPMLKYDLKQRERGFSEDDENLQMTIGREPEPSWDGLSLSAPQISGGA